jgi:ketosteroid isomerase-like protein
MSQENIEALRGVRYRVTLPGGSASQRRSLDERLFVRLPVLYHLIAAALTRLPPRSRFRRLIPTRYVRRAYAAINRRDFEVLFLGLDPHIEYIAAGDVLPSGMFPPVSHGHAGYEGNWRQLIDSFEDFRVEPEEIFDMGDTLLACNRYVGHGSGSGVPVEVSAFQLVRLRNGLAF